MGFEAPLWRAIAVFRAAALVYAGVLIISNADEYRSPAGGWAVLAVMALWTAYAGYAYADPARRRWPLLAADLAVAAGCLLATAWVERPERIFEGAPTLPLAWVTAPVLAWGVSGGKRRGSLAAVLIGICGVTVHGVSGRGLVPSHATFNGVVLVFMAGFVAGHIARLGIEAEAQLARAVELEAATRERERLARRIHDSVLQVLTLVQRRGDELGGEAAELGRLAGEQEAALRALIGVTPESAERGDGTETDLRALLAARSSTAVTVSTPATPVRLPARAAREIDAAVGAALDNVRRHCGPGARAWVLLEDDPDNVTVSVRDDGPGIPAGRLAEAAAAGRLGVDQSIKGRIRDLGGRVSIVSEPGEGTEIEMTVPLP
jgi:signal transduction histidine kinase